MRQLASAICLAMTMFAAPVEAVETFTIPYLGSGLDFVDCTFQPLNCGPRTVPWNPIVTVQTVSGADGVYSFNVYPPDNPANTLTFLSLVANTLAGSSWPTQGSPDSLIGGNLTATVQGGRVTSIDGLIVGAFQASWFFAGTEVDFNRPLFEKAGPFSGHAAVVPEPETSALMIAGLVAGAWARRRTKRSP